MPIPLLRRRERKRTVTDYVMLAVFGLMLGGLGVTLIVVGVREHFIQRRLMATAVPVDAVILSAEVKTTRSADTDSRPLRDNSTTSHTPEVRFAYTFGGVRYESDQLYPTIIQRAYASAESAAEDIREYAPGKNVRAYADASAPERGFLRLEASNNPKWFALAGVLTLCFFAVISRFL